SARTYLERRFDTFPQASLDDLIEHGLRALRDTLAQDKSLDTLNCSIAYVGKDTDFTLLDGEAVAPYLSRLESDGGDGTGAAPLGSDSVAPMETEA
ncbi:Proteasome subunit alpha type-6, partial [Tieghemiomyces parasiticus]